jgi:2-succinyl-6-hydroxy-2,4-cyclohexadiene-1-carboxylate synthase
MHQFLGLHGFTGRGSDFEPLLEALPGDWQCPDLPGHGPNPYLPCGPAAMLAVVDKAVDQFPHRSAARRILIGYSMGARLALQHLCQKRAFWDGVILISPSAGLKTASQRAERRQADTELAGKIEADGVAAFLRYWQNTPMIRSQQKITEPWKSRMQQKRLEHLSEGLASSLREFGQGSCPNLWAETRSLTAPTLLLTGSEDPKYSELAARLQGSWGTATMNQGASICRHEIVAGAGHAPHFESPGQTVASILRFLASLGAA